MHLEELKMFLENETWQCCPVKADFSIFNLQEYKFLKKNPNQLHFSSPVLESVERNIQSSNQKSLIEMDKFNLNENMIELISTKERNFLSLFSGKNSASVDRDSLLNGNGGHFQDETEDPVSSDNAEAAILTNTTLNIIRLFGKYINMLSIFKIISYQVVSYLMQLFQFYFYYIYLDFTNQVDNPMVCNFCVFRPLLITWNVNLFINVNIRQMSPRMEILIQQISLIHLPLTHFIHWSKILKMICLKIQ